MPPRPLRTSQIASAAGVHPNTVRLYEALGLIPPARRSPKGYRLFTQRHLKLMVLARTALGGPFPGRRVRRSAFQVVKRAASSPRAARAAVEAHLAVVLAERKDAEDAAAVLERWVRGHLPGSGPEQGLLVNEAAKRLGVTADMLRDWERNGLLRVPRNFSSGYRRFRPQDLGRATVIRTLLRAGYSTMAVRRMFRLFDRGVRNGLKHALDTPRPEEDMVSATDRWITTLAEAERRALEMRKQVASWEEARPARSRARSPARAQRPQNHPAAARPGLTEGAIHADTALELAPGTLRPGPGRAAL